MGDAFSPRATFIASRVDQGRRHDRGPTTTEANNNNNNNINKRPTMRANSVRTTFATMAIAIAAALATASLANAYDPCSCKEPCDWALGIGLEHMLRRRRYFLLLGVKVH